MEQIYVRVLGLCLGLDVDVRRQYITVDLAMILSQGTRLVEDRPVAVPRLARLIRYLDTRDAIETPMLMHYLAKALISIKDNPSAQVAIFCQLNVKDCTFAGLSGKHCEGCQSENTPATGRHMCRLCEDIDLCNMCMCV